MNSIIILKQNNTTSFVQYFIFKMDDEEDQNVNATEDLGQIISFLLRRYFIMHKLYHLKKILYKMTMKTLPIYKNNHIHMIHTIHITKQQT